MHTTHIKIQDDSIENEPEITNTEVFEDSWDIEIGHYDRFYRVYPNPLDKSKLVFDTYDIQNTGKGNVLSKCTVKSGSLTP